MKTLQVNFCPTQTTKLNCKYGTHREGGKNSSRVFPYFPSIFKLMVSIYLGQISGNAWFKKFLHTSSYLSIYCNIALKKGLTTPINTKSMLFFVKYTLILVELRHFP